MGESRRIAFTLLCAVLLDLAGTIDIFNNGTKSPMTLIHTRQFSCFLLPILGCSMQWSIYSSTELGDYSTDKSIIQREPWFLRIISGKPRALSDGSIDVLDHPKAPTHSKSPLIPLHPAPMPSFVCMFACLHVCIVVSRLAATICFFMQSSIWRFWSMPPCLCDQ